MKRPNKKDKKYQEYDRISFRYWDDLEKYIDYLTSLQSNKGAEEIEKEDFIKNGFSKSENGYIIRISDLIWCEVDKHGFAELRRKRENAVKQKPYDKVIIPRPIKTKKDLNTLLITLGMQQQNK